MQKGSRISNHGVVAAEAMKGSLQSRKRGVEGGRERERRKHKLENQKALEKKSLRKELKAFR